jgi:hypothetical protein
MTVLDKQSEKKQIKNMIEKSSLIVLVKKIES